MDNETLKLLRKIREIDEFEAISELSDAEKRYRQAVEDFKAAVQKLRDFESQMSEQTSEGVNRSDLLLFRRQRQTLKEEVRRNRRRVRREESAVEQAKESRMEAEYEMQRQKRLEDKKSREQKKSKRQKEQRLLDDLASRNDPTQDDAESY